MANTADRERLRVLTFYAGAVLLAYLLYQLFLPFLVPLAWAAVIAICFHPAHRRFEHRFGPGRAALLSTVCVAVLIVVPILGVASAFVSEASTIPGDVPRALAEMPASVQRWLQTALRYVPGGEAIDAAGVLADAARRLASLLSAKAAGIIQDAVVSAFDVFFTLFALFFLLRDGAAVMAALRRIIPLERETRERLIAEISAMVTASVTSGLAVAAAQGVLGGLAFWVVGLRAPVFWGVVMAIFCLLPFGAWVVWAPAALWLVATGSVGRGLVLAGLGVGIVSSVDNVLRPALLSGRSKMNGLLLFISLIGGVVTFGTVGLIAGPVLMAAGVVLFDASTSSELRPAVR